MRPIGDISKILESKRSIILSRNQVELCCARVIVTVIARHELHPQLNSTRNGRYIRDKWANDLHDRDNVPLRECGIEEVNRFQAVLAKYQLFVLSKDHFNSIVYSGPEGGIPLHLYM